MYNLSQNYHLRKCFFKKDEVPTQSLMIQKMNPALANVYFKSMSSNLRVLAGFEPPLKGGGNDWFMPPEEILGGRAVLKPLKKEMREKWNFLGIDEIGMKLTEIHRERMANKRTRLLMESDESWPNYARCVCDDYYREQAALKTEYNTHQLKQAFNQFTSMYSTSITKFQDLLFEAAINKIKQFRQKTFQEMNVRYERLLKQQATKLYDEYTEKLAVENALLKAKFIENLESIRSKLGENLHKINLEKHVAIEKLRKYIECRNLACRVYVALKERQECSKEIEFMKYQHAERTDFLTKELISADVEILLAREKEKRQREYTNMWMKKVCLVVKHFQTFVSYSLKKFPEYADFFINIEKLLLLQLSTAMEKPTVDSIFVFDIEEQYSQTLLPKPQPFYLFCDENSKPTVCQNLCPKHCSSSKCQLPAIIINKTCIYAACDNFEQFTDQIKDYILLNRGIDDDLIDHHEYQHDVPVKCSSSQQMRELKLESSIMQMLQKEIINLSDAQFVCAGCKVPHCFSCSDKNPSVPSLTPEETHNKSTSVLSVHSSSTGNKIRTRKTELDFQREPKWESYMEYVKPKKCNCNKLAKKHLLENLPAYMRKMSYYETPELPNYKPCSLESLKTLVNKARCKKTISSLPPKESKTKDVATEIDVEFDLFCNCSSEDAKNFCRNLIGDDSLYYDDERHFRVIGSSKSTTYLSKEHNSFVIHRALSLKRLINQAPDIAELFITKDCSFS